MKKSLAVFTLIGLFIVAGIFAQTGSKRFYRGGGFHQRSANPFRLKSLDRIYDKRNQLNLTDEQVEKIKNLIYEFRTAQSDRKAEIEKARIKLQHLKTGKSASMESVMEAIDQLHQMEAEAEKGRYRFQAGVRSILTEDQLKKLEKLRKSRRSNAHKFLPPIERELIFENGADI